MGALQGLPARILALTLLLQAVGYYAVASRQDVIPQVAPLSTFPGVLGDWRVVQENQIEKEVQDVLRADDTLNRVYVSSGTPDPVSFFVAFFKTQRYGQAPHSPKNCLPGSGWEPTDDRKISISLPDRPEPIVVNRYLIERGDHKSVVLYWYHSRSRVVAGEFDAKFWLVADALRYRRSDTALVRVIVPVRPGSDTAEATAIDFVRAAFPAITRQLPQ